VDKDPNAVAVILARTSIPAKASEVKRLTFGYSDLVSVFLNGRLLYSGDSSFLRRDDMFAGTVGLNDDLYLPLEPGDNELLFVLTDGLGGWGLKAQLRPLPAGPVALAAGVSKRWELTEGLRNPETVLLDQNREVLYVSNANLQVQGDEPAGFLSRVRLDGMALHGDRLLVVERTGVAGIDVAEGAIVARHAIAPAGMLNDVAVAPDGTVYVSDSRASTVFRLRDGKAEPWLSGAQLDGANGLHVDGSRLVVACSRAGTLVFVDRDTGTVEEIVEVPGTLDGVESYGEEQLIVSDFGGVAYLVLPNGERSTLVDTSEAGLSCANLAFDPKTRLLATPMLLENRVVVYEVGDIGP
jgi:hypothetical protein